MGSLKDVKYDAFISYRHSEFDSFVVENLHKKLENFKLPKSVLKKVKNGRTRINRVFRDVDELPLADNLSEPINDALRNSDYLITVCTPRYPQSRWCMKEIETFLETHTRDHILVVLAEDEPVNSFPEILMLEEVETVDEKGEKVIIRKELEPLAADTRGDNKKEVLKAMDTAVIKLAAAMFGLNFDDLRQRQREQKTRRMAAVFGSIGLAVLAFAIFATATLIKISKQNVMINEQYAKLQDSFAGTMANVSEQLLKEGRRKDAVYAVRNVLPDNKEAGYNSSAFNALVSAMDVYKVSKEHSPVCTYDADGWISEYHVSYNGNFVILIDSSSIYLYEASSGKLIKRIDQQNKRSGYWMFEAGFCGEEGMIVFNSGDVTYYSLADDTSKSVDIDSESVLYESDDGYVTYAAADSTLYAIDNYGELIYTQDIQGLFDADDSWISDVSFRDGKALLFADSIEKTCLCVIDEYSGEVLYTGTYGITYRVNAETDGDTVYVAMTVDGDTTSYKTDVFAVSLVSGREKWRRSVDALVMVEKGSAVSGDWLFLCGNSDVVMLDKKSGDIINSHSFTNDFCSGWVDEDWFYFVMGDGTVIRCSEEYPETQKEFYTIQPTEKVFDVAYRDGELFCRFEWATYITRYSTAISPFARPADDYEEEFELCEQIDNELFQDEEYGVDPNMVSNAVYSLNHKYIMAVFLDHVVRIFDAQTKECVKAFISPEEQLYEMRYSDLTGCYIISGNESYLLDDDFNIVCETGYIAGEEGSELILETNDYARVRIPWLQYEDILEKADEYLGDYTPSDAIKQKYGLE